MSALSQPMTIADFIMRSEYEFAELVEGVPTTYPPGGFRHGVICVKASCAVGAHVDDNDLGHVSSCDSWVQTGPGTLRTADVCFFSYGRLPKGPIPDGILDVSPELIVEVRKPSDRWTYILVKVAEYLNVGVLTVVVLDPPKESVIVFRDGEFPQTFHNGGELIVPDVLPGFAVPLSRLFA